MTTQLTRRNVDGRAKNLRASCGTVALERRGPNSWSGKRASQSCEGHCAGRKQSAYSCKRLAYAPLESPKEYIEGSAAGGQGLRSGCRCSGTATLRSWCTKLEPQYGPQECWYARQ